MKREVLQVFIDVASKYFKHASTSEVVIGTPFLTQEIEPSLFDYTGVIHVSGERGGSVYFSASSGLLENLLAHLGEDGLHRENILDMVGEVANTISGNARRALGRDFVISTPTVLEGKVSKDSLNNQDRFYVIPVSWEGCEAAIITCFNTRD